MKEEHEHLLAAEEGTEAPKPVGWWQRRNRCFPRMRNGPCCLVAACVYVLLSLVIGIPLVVKVFIPWGIRATIDRAPPLEIRMIDIQHLYAGNESIGMWFDARVPMESNGVSSEFLPSTYSVSLLEPGKKNYMAGMDLGYFEMNGFQQGQEGVILDFYTVFHHANVDHLKQAMRMGADYLRSLLLDQLEDTLPSADIHGENQSVSVSSAKETIWRLHMEGAANVKMFGFTFYGVHIYYNIPIDFDIRSIISKFDPKKEKCAVLGDEGQEVDCDKLNMPAFMDSFSLSSAVVNGVTRFDDDEDPAADAMQIVLTSSFVNPTPFGINFGTVNNTIYYRKPNSDEPAPFAKVVIPDMQFHKSSERQQLTMKVLLFDPLTALELLKEWRANVTRPRIYMPGKDIQIGKPVILFDTERTEDTDVVSAPIERVTWFENLLKDFDIDIELPPMDQLPIPVGTV